jgi:hypothetical protein
MCIKLTGVVRVIGLLGLRRYGLLDCYVYWVLLEFFRVTRIVTILGLGVGLSGVGSLGLLQSLGLLELLWLLGLVGLLGLLRLLRLFGLAG